MEKMVDVRIGTSDYTLTYTLRAMLDVMGRYGTEQELLRLLSQATAEGFAALMWTFCRMAGEGNQCRKDRGLPEREIPDGERLGRVIYPGDIADIQKAVLDALTAGHKRQKDEEKREVDTGLEEFEKKTQSRSRKRTSGSGSTTSASDSGMR